MLQAAGRGGIIRRRALTTIMKIIVSIITYHPTELAKITPLNASLL